MARRLLAIVVALAALPFGAARADTTQVQVRFLGISSWTAPDRPLEISLSIANRETVPIEGASVRVSIYRRVRSRSELRAALDGRPAGGDPLAVTTEELDSPLNPGEDRPVTVRRDLGPLSTSFRLPFAHSGVYPVDVELRDSAGRVGRWHTATTFFSSPPVTRLNIAWIWMVHPPPAFTDTGDENLDGLRATLAGDLPGSIAALAARPSARVTLGFSGSLLDSLAGLATPAPVAAAPTSPADDLSARSASLLADLRTAGASGSAELAPIPYASADLGQLATAGLGQDAALQVSEGRAAISRALAGQPSLPLFIPANFALAPQSGPTLATLGVRRLVLAPSALLPPEGQPVGDSRFAPSRPVTVQTSGGSTFEALLVDPDIRDRLGGGEDPVLLAQGVLAESASAYFELPGLADARLLVVAGDGTPGAATATALLDGLAGAPWLRARTASEALDALPPDGEPIPLQPVRFGRAPALTAARAAREMFGRVKQVAAEPPPAIEALDRMVLAAESADWSPDRAERLAAAARRRAEDFLSRIRAAGRRVTLTSHRGKLPVTVLNNTGVSIRVRLRLESAKVLFPQGDTRTIQLDGRDTTVVFPAEARAAGTFGVTVNIETPDGGSVIGSGEVVVRSTAVSAVALAATGGGALFLLGGTIRRARRRRRRAARG